MNPIEALTTIRGYVVSALSLGVPAVDYIGFADSGATYDCNCDGTSGRNGVLRVEWDSYESAEDGGGIDGGMGCTSDWILSGAVIVRRCMPAFGTVAGTTIGNAPEVADRQARSSALTVESWDVVQAMIAARPIKVTSCNPWGPDGNCAGYDIRFTYVIESD